MDGIIIINKEKGWTSNDVVQKVKGILQKKVGHTGTLDPLASGVLPILVGKGTSLSKYLVNHDKEYIAKIALGQKTTTGDSEGEIVEEKNVPKEILEKEKITQVLNSFKGKQKQVPPIYSAIKVNGKKLYEYVRKGQTIEINPREIEIYNIELLDISLEKQEIEYKVSCSKGTYIRTLSENIAEKLGTCGFMKELQRTKVGNFTIEQAIKISDIEKNLNQKFITIEEFFKDKEKITLNNFALKLFLNGVNLSIERGNETYRIYDENNTFIGTGILNNNKLKRDICI